MPNSEGKLCRACRKTKEAQGKDETKNHGEVTCKSCKKTEAYKHSVMIDEEVDKLVESADVTKEEPKVEPPPARSIKEGSDKPEEDKPEDLEEAAVSFWQKVKRFLGL
jgi:hypothetical protein